MDDELNIARRTRSHICINELPEGEPLNFPDVDMSLYQNTESEIDPLYKKFLEDCYDETHDTNTDDNDPEYIYNDDIFSHGWRYDINEFDLDCNRDVAGTSQQTKKVERKIDMFADPKFVKVLNQQLRQHIQLLTQTYLLTRNTTHMRNEADEAKNHLNSYMKIFKNKTKPSNLLPALAIVNNPETPRELRSSIRLSWRPLPIPETVKHIISSNPNVFIYPSLLPQVAFSFLPENLMPKKPKINFTTNEDKLLAYALNEFKGESSPYAYIASLLMTAKTKTQIINHIKNIKRPGNKKNEDNPINLYYDKNILPEIDLDCDPDKPESNSVAICDSPNISHQDNDDLMNMDLDDLMLASTKIAKSSVNETNTNKNMKHLKLKKSMLRLMSHNFTLSPEMGDLIVDYFLKTAQKYLSDINYSNLLQRLGGFSSDGDKVQKIYQGIIKFLNQIYAPNVLHDCLVLFLNLEQATSCGCAANYLHWMRFFEFVEHVKLYHDSGEALEKKLARLIDSLQKEDAHKIKLAVANLTNKHPFLMREFESLPLDGKPHPSLFINDEEFDDITDPINIFDSTDGFEHFTSKVSQEELSYASQTCPCGCHKETTDNHCGKCNLKFMRGRIYLVNKIKPILAEWSYVEKPTTPTKDGWTLQEDREILEFCRSKAEQNEETVSFDTSTFEELIAQQSSVERNADNSSRGCLKRTAREIAERFNQLMDMYRDENT